MAKRKNQAAVSLGSLGGKARAKAMIPEERQESASKAGKARAKKLSAKRRSEIARKAAQARAAKMKK